MTTMIDIYIISSWGEHLQEAEGGIGGGVRWLGGRWDVTLYFLSIVNFSCVGRIRRHGMETQEYPEWTVEGIN